MKLTIVFDYFDVRYKQKYEGVRGVKDTPHWKVEGQIRRRKELDRLGSSPVLTEEVESALAVKIYDASKEGLPYTSDQINEVLLETAIRLGVKNSRTNS